MISDPDFPVNPLPAKLAAANLREFAEAYYVEADMDGVPYYPIDWLTARKISGAGYQRMYNTLTGRNPYPGTSRLDTDWIELIAFSNSDKALFWLFLAAAIESGDL